MALFLFNQIFLVFKTDHQKASDNRKRTASMERRKGRWLEKDHQTDLDRTSSSILERDPSALLDRGKCSLYLCSRKRSRILNKKFRLIESKSSEKCPQDLDVVKSWNLINCWHLITFKILMLTRCFCFAGQGADLGSCWCPCLEGSELNRNLIPKIC